mmetsp:Transcript_46836/g.110263  ORF Transcript_46836/g.110263 Transcript_46836/m.110263 type:complete len:272 (+) Transcript_46836:156-971(+)
MHLVRGGPESTTHEVPSLNLHPPHHLRLAHELHVSIQTLEVPAASLLLEPVAAQLALLSAACELLFGVPVANAGPDAVFGVVRPHCALPQTPAVHLALVLHGPEPGPGDCHGGRRVHAPRAVLRRHLEDASLNAHRARHLAVRLSGAHDLVEVLLAAYQVVLRLHPQRPEALSVALRFVGVGHDGEDEEHGACALVRDRLRDLALGVERIQKHVSARPPAGVHVHHALHRQPQLRHRQLYLGGGVEAHGVEAHDPLDDAGGAGEERREALR